MNGTFHLNLNRHFKLLKSIYVQQMFWELLIFRARSGLPSSFESTQVSLLSDLIERKTIQINNLWTTPIALSLVCLVYQQLSCKMFQTQVVVHLFTLCPTNISWRFNKTLSRIKYLPQLFLPLKNIELQFVDLSGRVWTDSTPISLILSNMFQKELIADHWSLLISNS